MLFQKSGCSWSSAGEGGIRLDLVYIWKLLKTHMRCVVKAVNDLRAFGHKSRGYFGSEQAMD